MEENLKKESSFTKCIGKHLDVKIKKMVGGIKHE